MEFLVTTAKWPDNNLKGLSHSSICIQEDGQVAWEGEVGLGGRGGGGRGGRGGGGGGRGGGGRRGRTGRLKGSQR